MKTAGPARHSWTDSMGKLVLWSIGAICVWVWYADTFRKPMTYFCAYMLDAHPVGADAALDTDTLDRVMHCRLDKMRYGQKDWPVPACTEADLAYAKERPNSPGKLCK